MKFSSLIFILAVAVFLNSRAQDAGSGATPAGSTPAAPAPGDATKEAGAGGPSAGAPAGASPSSSEVSATGTSGKSKKPPKSNVGDKSFIGDPDPLDVLEPKRQNNLSSESSEPVFEEIADILDEKPKKKTPKKKAAKAEVAKAPEPPPADPAAGATTPEPPKPDILTDDFKPPTGEVTPEEPKVVGDATPTSAPDSAKNKKKKKTKKAKQVKVLKTPKVIVQRPKRVDPILAEQIAGDEPDFKREERLHRMYLKYNQSPTSDQEWGTVSTGRRSMSYEIQKGDTLSDVSATLFGDSKFWPKVWALNSNSITNPHFILPRMSLKFYPGTIDQAPGFQVGGQESSLNDSKPVEEKVATEGAPVNSDDKDTKAATEKPKDQKEKEEEIAGLPANESKTKLLNELPIYFDRNIDMKKPKMNAKLDLDNILHPKVDPLPFYIPYQIVKDEKDFAGVIVSGSDNRTVFSDGQECIVSLNREAKAHDLFYASIKKVSDAYNSDNLIFENVGELEILDVVNPEEKMYRVMVKKAIGLVIIGAQLSPGRLPTFDIHEKASVGEVKTQILGAAHDENTQVIGPDAFVVLAAGSKSGVAVGQEFSVLENQLARYGIERIIQNEKRIGKVRVVQVNEDYSTAYVVNVEAELKPGDFIGRLAESTKVE